MASLIDFSFRDLRDKFLADLSKAECEVREHLVNATAVIQVRGAVPASVAVQSSANVVPASANADEIAALEKKLHEQENAHTAAVMTLEKDIKKLRKENVELQGKLKDTEAVDKLEADLEAAHRQIRTLTQENLVFRNTQDLNDKYAAQDKKTYADLQAKYKALEEKYAALEQSAKTEELKKESTVVKEVKKVEKRQPEPEPEPEEEKVEEEAEEEAEEEEEGEEPVEFEYKGKTYYLSSDNDVYQMENDEFVQVGTWNGKKILFQ